MMINADNFAWLAMSPTVPDILNKIHNLTPWVEKS